MSTTPMTSSADAPLYAAREPIFPRRVQGFFRRLKWWIMGVTLAIYYVTPWIRWDRGPYQPDQAVLVDLANRRFYFFWIEIWPDEFYYVAGLLIMAGLGLFLFTSILGRVWCGYACPQTVWTDLFILVERWIEGDRNARIRLWNRKWDAYKIRLRLEKWAVWLLIGVATGGAWIFYFADAPTLAIDLVTGQAPFVAYSAVGILTFTTFVFGGFMREQVCIYMCPWPRIQAAMMDPNTLTVAYRDWRGEPRGKHRKRADADKLGDCIDCNACVAVCPTGVDIRKGQQLGCITCALCIDACDDVMARIGRPRGLIDYITLADGERERAGGAPAEIWRRIVRPRTALYFALWAGIGLGMLTVLFLRESIDIGVAHDRNPTYVTLSDGAIRNAYEVTVANREGMPQRFRLSMRSELDLTARLAESESMEFEVQPDRTRDLRLFLESRPGADVGGHTPVEIWVENLSTRERESAGTVFMGPER